MKLIILGVLSILFLIGCDRDMCVCRSKTRIRTNRLMSKHMEVAEYCKNYCSAYYKARYGVNSE